MPARPGFRINRGPRKLLWHFAPFVCAVYSKHFYRQSCPVLSCLVARSCDKKRCSVIVWGLFCALFVVPAEMDARSSDFYGLQC